VRCICHSLYGSFTPSGVLPTYAARGRLAVRYLTVNAR
jgi:hypothetical protein